LRNGGVPGGRNQGHPDLEKRRNEEKRSGRDVVTAWAYKEKSRIICHSALLKGKKGKGEVS